MDALLTVGDETMDDQFVSIGKAAKMIGMSIQVLRKWASAGILLPVRTLTNPRRYRVTDLRALMGEDPSPAARDTRCILYARVSTRKQPEAGTSDRQLGRLPSFAAEPQGTVIAALPDVARGLNEKRRGLRQLLSLVQEKQAAIVVVEYQDRLARFGFAYLETFLRAVGAHIVGMERTPTDEHQELVHDLIAITTSFSARIYGQRGGRQAGTAMRRTLAMLAREGASD